MFKTYGPLMAGLAATLIWGIGPGVARGLAEDLGPFASGAMGNTMGGLVLLFYKWRTTGLRAIKNVPRIYWILCAPIYVLFMASSVLSIGLVETREEVITLGLIRLLWPLSTLILTIPIMKAKASPWLIVGLILCFFGVLAPYLDPASPSLFAVFGALLGSGFPGIMALVSATSWGLYSNWFSKYIKHKEHDFISVLLLFSGLFQFGAAMIVYQPFNLQLRHTFPFAFQVIFSTFLANVFWNMAMRSKYSLAVIILANLVPVFSTVLTGLMLGVTLTWPMLLGAALVVAGTMWSKRCFRPTKPQDPSEPEEPAESAA